MTMTAFRKEIKARKQFDVALNGGNLVSYYEEIEKVVESLWKNGYAENFSNDILALANGYQVNSGNYAGCNIKQTLDLRSITMDKAAVKEFAAYAI